MSGNTFGKIFKVTTFGESHGLAVGCIVDGCPAGLELSEKDIQVEMDKRKPGSGVASSKRTEEDKVQILSGVFEGKTTGTPIALIVFNQDQKSKDYTNIKDVFRPGHADYGFFMKYGIRDYRGGGRSSGRETLARVAAGAIAKKILETKGIKIYGYVKEIAGIECKNYDLNDIKKVYENDLRMPDKKAYEKALQKTKKAITEQDSLGGIIEIIATGVPAGLGEPVFNKLDAEIASAIMGIGTIKGVEIGSGFGAAKSKGSINNDQMKMSGKKVVFLSNNAGGIIGGISTGQDIIVRAVSKPTSSIALKQKTINTKLEEQEIQVIGRHDTCIAPRALPVAENMLALVLIDALLQQKAKQIF